MPYAVTHVLSAGIAADLIRTYFLKNHKKFITINTVLIAAVAGLIPDIDIILSAVFRYLGYSLEYIHHGGITHTLLFALIFIFPAIILWKKDKKKAAGYFFAVSFGIITHLVLDFIFGGGSASGLMLFWPVSSERVAQLSLLAKIGLSAAALDAVMLITWLIYEIKTAHLREFI